MFKSLEQLNLWTIYDATKPEDQEKFKKYRITEEDRRTIGKKSRGACRRFIKTCRISYKDRKRTTNSQNAGY